MRIAAKNLDESSMNERDEIVEFLWMAADESKINTGDVVADGEPRCFDGRFILLKKDKARGVVRK